MPSETPARNADLAASAAGCERYDKAMTPGPWQLDKMSGWVTGKDAAVLRLSWSAHPCEADCAGFIELRNLLPQLIAHLRAGEAAMRERDKLQAFKDWCHQYLDKHGVPHHPPGTHGAEGCRIGDRMDWVLRRAALAPPPQPGGSAADAGRGEG